jgi:glycosyltransferase involved in cell wall biosynthesis
VVTSLGGYVPDSPLAATRDSGNLRVTRLWTPRLGKERGLFRIIDYAFFYVQAALRFAFLPAQDVIVSLTTPPFIAWVGVLHKLLHPAVKLVLWNMDSYPEILERTGVLSEDGVTARLLRKLNMSLFRQIDFLVCLDDAMSALLLSNYKPENGRLPSAVVPNWEPRAQFDKPFSTDQLPASLSLDLEGQFVVLYLGNAGFGHRFETVLEAATSLQQDPVTFLFVGGGKKWPELKARKEELRLDNFYLHPYVPKELTPAVMNLADCALITLTTSVLGVISPSKLHSNLAMSLPILYVGPEGGNVDQAINEFDCGLSLRHGEVSKMVEFIRALQSDKTFLQGYQSKARQAFDQAYNDRVALPQFDKILDSLTPSQG